MVRSEGKTIDYIVNNTMLSKRTIINYTNKYLENNRFFHRKNHKRSVLYTRKDEILKGFRKKPPKSYKEAATRIKELYGIITQNETVYTSKVQKTIEYTPLNKINPHKKIKTKSS